MTGRSTFLDDNSNCSVSGCMGVYRRIFYPLRDVVWLEHPPFQEELVKSPKFHNFADPFLHNIVIKDIFPWVYLVSTEQITNRISIQAEPLLVPPHFITVFWLPTSQLF